MSDIINFKFDNKNEELRNITKRKIIDVIDKLYKTKDANDNRMAYIHSMMELININNSISNLENIEIKKYLQMGFIVILDEYGNSKNVKEYMAKLLLNYIMIIENDILETKLHKKYNSKDELIKEGINNILLDVVSMHDSNLSTYLKTNISLLNEYHELIYNIIQNWDSYQENDNMIIVNLDDINDLLDEFISKYPEFNSKRRFLIFYLEKTFSFDFKKYYKVESIDLLNEDFNLNGLSLIEQKRLLEFKKIVSNYLKKNDNELLYKNKILKK